jgi:hypothetical protein
MIDAAGAATRRLTNYLKNRLPSVCQAYSFSLRPVEFRVRWRDPGR